MVLHDSGSAQAYGREVLAGEQVRLCPLDERDLEAARGAEVRA